MKTGRRQRIPNWCSYTYKCVGDLRDMRSLCKALRYIGKRKASIIKNGLGKWWLGNLMVKLGGNWGKYRCQGETTYCGLNDNILTICQNTAWCEQEGVRRIMEEKFPSIKVYYRGEESGYGVYYTSDANGEYFPERYYLDSHVDDSECSTTIREAADHVSGIIGGRMGPNKSAIEETLNEYMEEPNDENIRYSSREFTVVDE